MVIKKHLSTNFAEDDYCEEDEDQIMRMENIVKKMSEELKEYEI